MTAVHGNSTVISIPRQICSPARLHLRPSALVVRRPEVLRDLVDLIRVIAPLDLGHLHQLLRAGDAGHVHDGGVVGAVADTLVEGVPLKTIDNA